VVLLPGSLPESCPAAETALLSPRESYNAGTAKLREGKLREAEAALQAAVAGELEALQPRALYNLGHVRFRQGAEALKESAGPDALPAQGGAAAARGTRALRAADAALAEDNVQAILEAYLQARGAHKDLKSATDAVRRALERFGGVLGRWRRASGDFKSAFELRPSDADAQFNADVTDRHIADLVDRMDAMQMMMGGVGLLRVE
jgi:tetratricopeptide (TPR) repeat protein